MYKELETCIDYYCQDDEYLKSYWHMEGYKQAEEILENFKDDDWKRLISELPNKEIIWKKRLLYCLDGSNEYQLSILVYFANNGDDEMFKDAVSVLKNSDISVLNNVDEFISKAQGMISDASPLDKRILNEFIDECKKK